jgi:hypothetical protein
MSEPFCTPLQFHFLGSTALYGRETRGKERDRDEEPGSSLGFAAVYSMAGLDCLEGVETGELRWQCAEV